MKYIIGACNQYFKFAFTKISGIRNNLINRTMYELSSPEERRSNFHILEMVALSSTRDILKYGTLAVVLHRHIIRMQSRAYGSEIYKLDYYLLDKNLVIDKSNINLIINSLDRAHGYINDTPVWSNIIKYLKLLAREYAKYLNIKKNDDEKFKSLNMLLAYCSFIDQLSHHNGVFFEWLLEAEAIVNRYKGQINEKEHYCEVNVSAEEVKDSVDSAKDLTHVRDVAQLNKPQDVLHLIIDKVDTKLPFQDSISRILSTTKPSSKQEIEEELSIIKLKKFLKDRAFYEFKNLGKHIDKLKQEYNDLLDFLAFGLVDNLADQSAAASSGHNEYYNDIISYQESIKSFSNSFVITFITSNFTELNSILNVQNPPRVMRAIQTIISNYEWIIKNCWDMNKKQAIIRRLENIIEQYNIVIGYLELIYNKMQKI